MRFQARLRRLEKQLPAAGCPGCCDRRGRSAFVAARQWPDGTVAWEEDGPPPCAGCGAIPELIIEVIEVVVESRDAAG